MKASSESRRYTGKVSTQSPFKVVSYINKAGMVIPRAIEISFTFLIGAFIGSYVITIISRIRNKEKIRGGYSHCMDCGHKLEVIHIIPIISYIYYRGKCPFCKTKIGISTPMWEIGIGILSTIPLCLLDEPWRICILIGTGSLALALQLIMKVQ